MQRLLPITILLLACTMFAACVDNGTYYTPTDLKLIEEAQDCVQVVERQYRRGTIAVDKRAERMGECFAATKGIKNAPPNVDALMKTSTSNLLRIHGYSKALFISAIAAGVLLLVFFSGFLLMLGPSIVILVFGSMIGRAISVLAGTGLFAYSYSYPPVGFLDSFIGAFGSLLLIASLVGWQNESKKKSPFRRITTSLLMTLAGTALLLGNAYIANSALFLALAAVFFIVGVHGFIQSAKPSDGMY